MAIRSLLSLAFMALGCAAVADLRDHPLGYPVSEAERAAFAGACDYYDARSAAEDGTPAGTFTAFLAETCARAEGLLESGTPEQRARSALLLDRITELRRTIASMNMIRASSGARGYVPVSPSGEFLIAHRLGVFLAFDVWVDTGVPFSVAAYP